MLLVGYILWLWLFLDIYTIIMLRLYGQMLSFSDSKSHYTERNIFSTVTVLVDVLAVKDSSTVI